MAFDITGLSAYVANNSKEIATKAVANAQTAKLFIDNQRVQFGVKGKEAILMMDASVNFQDGSSCGRTALGSVTLTDKHIEVKPIKDNQNLCPKELWNTFYNYALKSGQTPQEEFDPAFAQYIMDYRAKLISAEVEKILWQGDTTLTGSTNNKRIDGIKKQVGSGYAMTATGSTIINKLQNAVLSMPVEIRTQSDFVFFIGEDKAAEYAVALANANLYKSSDDLTVFGTTVKLIPTAGLNGSNKVYGTRISNFVLGMDGQSDADSASLRYSVETDQWYVDFAFAIGVSVIREAEVGVASI